MSSNKNESITDRQVKKYTDLSLSENGFLTSNEYFEQHESVIFNDRMEIQKSEKPKFICPYCNQSLSIKGGEGRDKRILHFKHPPSDITCPQKTVKTFFSKKYILAKKFKNCNESLLHKNLKWFIAEQASNNYKDFSNIEVEKREYHDSKRKGYHIPDVKASYKKNRLAFELQLSTTFLHEIVKRESYYRDKREMYLIWIFSILKEDIEDKDLLSSKLFQNFTTKDIFYSNYWNLFVIDKESILLSKERNDLILRCFYKEGDSFLSKYISFSELIFEEETKIIYYKKPKTKSEIIQEDVLTCIEKIRLSDKTNLDNSKNTISKNKPYRDCRWKRGRAFEKIVERHKKTFNMKDFELDKERFYARDVSDLAFLKYKLIHCKDGYVEKFNAYLNYIKINPSFKTNLYDYFNNNIYETDYEKYESRRLLKGQQEKQILIKQKESEEKEKIKKQTFKRLKDTLTSIKNVSNLEDDSFSIQIARELDKYDNGILIEYGKLLTNKLLKEEKILPINYFINKYLEINREVIEKNTSRIIIILIEKQIFNLQSSVREDETPLLALLNYADTYLDSIIYKFIDFNYTSLPNSDRIKSDLYSISVYFSKGYYSEAVHILQLCYLHNLDPESISLLKLHIPTLKSVESVKEGRVVGYDFSNIIQVLHSALESSRSCKTIIKEIYEANKDRLKLKYSEKIYSYDIDTEKERESNVYKFFKRIYPTVFNPSY